MGRWLNHTLIHTPLCWEEVGHNIDRCIIVTDCSTEFGITTNCINHAPYK